MPEEFTDDDLAIVQSMMKSNVIDKRNPYAVVPPQMVTPTRAEQAMTELPYSDIPFKDQQRFRAADEALERDHLAGDVIERYGNEGRGPRPLDPKLVAVMRDALRRPDLRQFKRPKSVPLADRLMEEG